MVRGQNAQFVVSQELTRNLWGNGSIVVVYARCANKLKVCFEVAKKSRQVA